MRGSIAQHVKAFADEALRTGKLDEMAGLLHNSAVPEEAAKLQSSTVNTLESLAESLVKKRLSMSQSFRYVSILVVLGALGVMYNAIVTIVIDIVTFHWLAIVVKSYQLFFGCLVIGLEVNRIVSIRNMRRVIRVWLPLFEYTFGRGLIQLLAAGLALGETLFTPGGFFSAVLGVIGFLNVTHGLAYMISVNQIRKKINAMAGENGELSYEATRKKFLALDVNGDGCLTRAELQAGCQQVNLPLSALDIEKVFQLLDPNKRGYIELDRLEQWWYGTAKLHIATLSSA